jgi:hemolysin activation/secretion protein
MKQGKGDIASIESQHTSQTAPGLGASPSFVHSQASVGIDWRRSPGYTRRGGLYEVVWHDYHSTSGGDYGFQRMTAEVIQHLPLLRETWVLAARGRVETAMNDNDVIPYYLLSSLGSGGTLRGYSSDRFRDRHSMLMNAEFRWLPSVGLDMALFYDAGKVTSRRNDLSFKGLKSDVGIGARFHGLFATPLRIDFAVGNEGWRLVLSGGPGF